MVAKYIDRPGIDSPVVIHDGHAYPVVMSIPIGANYNENDQVATTQNIPGFNIPVYDQIITVEDSNNKMKSVEYRLEGETVTTLTFSYSDYEFVEPNKITTVTKS